MMIAMKVSGGITSQYLRTHTLQVGVQTPATPYYGLPNRNGPIFSGGSTSSTKKAPFCERYVLLMADISFYLQFILDRPT